MIRVVSFIEGSKLQQQIYSGTYMLRSLLFKKEGDKFHRNQDRLQKNRISIGFIAPVHLCYQKRRLNVKTKIYETVLKIAVVWNTFCAQSLC